jgi:hypothetical protein
MFRTDRPAADAAAFNPVDADDLIEDEFFDLASDDYLDRCLFDLRTAASDFRNQ